MIKNIFNTFFLRIFNALINLVIAIVIARYLGAEIKGEQGLFLTTVSLLHIIMSIVGLGAIVYLIPRLNYSQLIVPSYIWAFFISILSYIALPYILPNATSMYLHISIITWILTISNLNISSLIAREKILLANRLVFLQVASMILSLLICIFVCNIRSVYAYIYALYISYSITLFLSYLPIYKEFSFSWSQVSSQSIQSGFKQLFHYGFFNQLDVFAQMLSFRFSYYLLSDMVGNKEVGIYSIAVSIAESLWLISRSISMVQNARVANTLDFEKNVELTLKFIKAASLLTISGLIVLLCIPSNIYLYIFGSEFYSLKQVILSIAPGIFFFSASFMISGLFSGIGKQYINSIASIVGLVITIAAAYILIPRYGIIGAGITASLSYISTTIVKLIYFKTQSSIEWSAFIYTQSDMQTYTSEIKNLILRLSRKTKT